MAEGKLCLTCHEKLAAKQSEATAHIPFAEGDCQECHGAHGTDQENLIKGQPGEVCLNCHADVEDVVKGYRVQHRPVAKMECVSCHSGHGSPHTGFTSKGQPALCLECHSEVAAFWRDGALHQPAAEDCTICHNAHGSDQGALLRSSVGELCADCHEQGTGRFIAAHQGIKPGPDSCVTCHDPHGGPEQNLLYPVNHTPFSPNRCTPCHEGRAQ